MSQQREGDNTEQETIQKERDFHEQDIAEDNWGSIPPGTSGRQAEGIKVVPPKEAGKPGCLSFHCHLPLAEAVPKGGPAHMQIGRSPKAQAGSHRCFQ